MYSCEFCGNDARYGHYCTPQVPFIYLEPCYNQDFNFPQDFHDFQQQYLCCENYGGPYETFQCQPMNEDYYEQDSCYDPNSFGFDQFQPPQYTVNHPIFNAQDIMEQMTSICDMVGQYMQKKEEERRIAEEQVAKDRYWKIPICYDDDEDYIIAITPSSVEDLVQIPSESKGISDDTCDVPVGENPSTFDALSNYSEILSDSNDDDTSSDDDDFKDIEYISLEEVNDVDQEEKEFDLEDILQIQDVILREKLLNINRLLIIIESLEDNPTPIPVTDSEEPDTSLSHLDNSLPEFETFSDHTKETRSGSTTTHANNSLLEYDSFLFEIEPDQGGLTSIVISDNSNDPLLELSEFESFHFDLSFPRPPPEPLNVEISLIIKTDAPVINDFDELNVDECFDLGGGEINVSQNVEDDDSFTFVIRTFLPFLTYHADSPLLLSTGSEDTIFDLGIST
ncbi:hypothetical protein Tco_0721627 [Tanacetum coccineum]